MQFWKMTPGEVFFAGGPLMWLILICSVVSLAIIIERYYYLIRAKANTGEFLQRVIAHLRAGKQQEAMAECDKLDTAAGRMIACGLAKYGRPQEEIREALEDSSLYEIPLLEKRMNALATIAHISPLLGLLGTVTGMVQAFQTIQAKSGAMAGVNPADLAGGIWEALLTTVFGLIVAIPTFVFYNLLVSKINAIVRDMERAATEFVNFVREGRG